MIFHSLQNVHRPAELKRKPAWIQQVFAVCFHIDREGVLAVLLLRFSSAVTVALPSAYGFALASTREATILLGRMEGIVPVDGPSLHPHSATLASRSLRNVLSRYCVPTTAWLTL